MAMASSYVKHEGGAGLSTPAKETPVLQLYSKDWVCFPIYDIDAICTSKYLWDIVRKNAPITLHVPELRGEIIRIVIEWMEHHKDEPEFSIKGKDKVRRFDFSDWDKLLLNVEFNELHEIIFAANYLEIPGLLDHCSQRLDLFKRQSLGIEETLGVKVKWPQCYDYDITQNKVMVAYTGHRLTETFQLADDNENPQLNPPEDNERWELEDDDENSQLNPPVGNQR